MNGYAGLLLKNPREVKRRSVHRMRDFIKRHALAYPRREICLRRFCSLRMVHVRTFAFRLTRHAMFDESRFKHVRDELQRRDVSPKRALVQRTKNYFFIAHACYRNDKRDPSSIRKIRG